MAKKKLFDWGDGNGRIHTIPKSVHGEHEQARQTGIPLGSVTQPLSGAQAYAQANAMAGAELGPKIRANQQMYTNVVPWYQNYINQTTGQATALAQQSQPILTTAQTAVTNAGATAPGLDPNSPQYAKEAQAALGRQVMAQDSANYLGGVAQAGQNYLSGQANVAQRELPQAQAGLLSQRAGLESDRAGKATGYFNDIRTGEVNADLARRTLGLNTATNAADIDLKRGVDPVTGEPLPVDAPTGYGPGAPGLNSYGFTSDEWSGMSETAKAKARAGKGTSGSGGLTAAQKQAAKERAATRVAGVREKSGKVLAGVDDAIGAWNVFQAKPVAVPQAPKMVDGKEVKQPDKLRKATTAEIRQQMLDAHYEPGMTHVALLRRVGKPLDKAAIDYLHSKGVRIPREWMPKPPSTARPNNAPDGNGGSRPT